MFIYFVGTMTGELWDKLPQSPKATYSSLRMAKN